MNIINKELIKMLELMNKYPKINRFVWVFTFLTFIVLMTYCVLNGLPTVLKALAEYRLAVGK